MLCCRKFNEVVGLMNVYGVLSYEVWSAGGPRACKIIIISENYYFRGRRICNVVSHAYVRNILSTPPPVLRDTGIHKCVQVLTFFNLPTLVGWYILATCIRLIRVILSLEFHKYYGQLTWGQGVNLTHRRDTFLTPLILTYVRFNRLESKVNATCKLIN